EDSHDEWRRRWSTEVHLYLRSSAPLSFTVSSVLSAVSSEQLPQMKLMRSQLAAVIAGGDLDDSGTARGVDAGAHGLFDSLAVEPVDNDFEHGIHAVRQFACDIVPATQRRTEGIVGRCNQLLIVPRPD